MKTPRYKGYPFSSKPNLEQHANVARQSAVESMVLLKNSNSTLPLKGVQRVALFGKTSYRFITGGTGSGEVNYAHAVSPREGLIKGGYMLVKPLEEVYEHFIDTLLSNSKQENKKFLVDFHSELDLSIAFIAKQEALSDVAIITIGRNSGEGWDRKEKDDFVLSEIEYSLIRNVSKIYHAARKRVVVVLNIGGVMEVASWRDYSDVILLAWQTGQGGGSALTDILIGNENPSGKLAVTFPMVYSDVPSAKIFPGEPKENPVNAFYNDGIYVGYRYYSSFHINTAYEFGFGMSYTDFQYSNLTLSETTFKDSMKVSVTIKNIGKVPGKEAVQLYISAPTNEIEKPALELKAFAKTELLKVSESQIVTFMLHPDLLASFWSGASAWIADKGQYEVQIGASSKDIRLKTAFTLPNAIMVEKVNNVLYPNYLLKEINQ